MAKEVTVVTDGTYSLEETKVENQFHFFRNDNDVLMDIGSRPFEMLASYLNFRAREQGIKAGYANALHFECPTYEISADRKILRITVSVTTKPNLRIVKSEESKVPEVTQPNFFMRVFTSWFGN